MKNTSIIKRHGSELMALVLFLAGSTLAMLGLIQKVHLVVGILGVVILASGLFFFCIRYTSEKVYKEYYKDSYEIEHETIEDEIRKSMVYHRYQEAVLGRWESACRDLGLVDEQKDWLLDLLMAEKKKVDDAIAAEGGGHI
ncbi:MAG: hypothetical protein J6X25_04625 [Bacteroidales bacterium]|jgi:hypothetical protein|nr:hypothetical protein [Bacteroidales bacterium]